MPGASKKFLHSGVFSKPVVHTASAISRLGRAAHEGDVGLDVVE
jgi:hypothetical protein